MIKYNCPKVCTGIPYNVLKEKIIYEKKNYFLYLTKNILKIHQVPRELKLDNYVYIPIYLNNYITLYYYYIIVHDIFT